MVRLSEKTFELNFCNQFERVIGKKILWFGLTQKQESQLGFDAATKINVHPYFFQFKASNYYKKNRRKFYTTHKQLNDLQKLSRAGLQVYYILPNIGETKEMINNPDLFNYTWFLDVGRIKKMKKPANKRELHYIYLSPPQAEIHSEICKVDVQRIENLFTEEKIERSDNTDEIRYIEIMRYIKNLGRNSVLALILD